MKESPISEEVLNHIGAALTRAPGEKANRRVRDQLLEARRLVLLAHRLEMAKQAQTSVEREEGGQRSLFDPVELKEKLQYARGLSSDGSEALKKAFTQLEKSGHLRPVAKAPDPSILDQLDVDFPNFAQATALLRRRLYLCRCAPEQLLKLPPILLDGPPGIGKTAYCMKLASMLALRFEQIDVSSGTTDFAMTGLDIGYSSGRPGRVWESLMHGSLSVLWLLDEIDKSSESTKHSSINYLLGLLEPVSSVRFMDSATLLPINASWIAYFATSNNKDAITEPLLTRFEVCDIRQPDSRQMAAVVRSIHKDLLANEDWATAFNPDIPGDAVGLLCNLSPRQIRKCLQDAYASAAASGRKVLQTSDFHVIGGSTTANAHRIGFI